MKLICAVSGIVTLWASLVLPTFAATIVTDSSFHVTTEDVFEDNLFYGGKDFLFEGVAKEDIRVLANRAALNGKVEKDVTIIANEAVISGVYDEDVIILSGSTVLDAEIYGDVLIFGGSVTFAEKAYVAQDVILLGGKMNIDGSIDGNIFSIAGAVDVNGNISGDSLITTQQLTFGDFLELSPQVMLSYFAPQESTVPQDITSQVTYNEVNSWQQNTVVENNVSIFFYFWSVLRVVTTAIIIFLLIALFKSFTSHSVEQGVQHPIRSGIVGALIFFGIPTIGLLLVVSLVGMPIGFVLLLVLSFIWILRVAIASMIIGGASYYLYHKSTDQKKDSYTVSFVWSLIGLGIVTLVDMIPYIGWWVVNIVYIIAIGAIGYSLYFGLVHQYQSRAILKNNE